MMRVFSREVIKRAKYNASSRVLEKNERACVPTRSEPSSLHRGCWLKHIGDAGSKLSHFT